MSTHPDTYDRPGLRVSFYEGPRLSLQVTFTSYAARDRFVAWARGRGYRVRFVEPDQPKETEDGNR